MMQTLYPEDVRRMQRIERSMAHRGDDRLNRGNLYQSARRIEKFGPIETWLEHNRRTPLADDVRLEDPILDSKLGGDSSSDSLDLIGPSFEPESGGKVHIFYSPNVPNYLRVKTVEHIPLLLNLALRSPYVHFGTDINKIAYFLIQPPEGVPVEDCLPKDVIIDGNVRRYLSAEGYGMYVNSCMGNGHTNPNGEDVRPIVLMLGLSDSKIQVTVEGDAYKLKPKRSDSLSWSRRINNLRTHDLLYSSSLTEERDLIEENTFPSKKAS